MKKHMFTFRHNNFCRQLSVNLNTIDLLTLIYESHYSWALGSLISESGLQNNVQQRDATSLTAGVSSDAVHSPYTLIYWAFKIACSLCVYETAVLQFI